MGKRIIFVFVVYLNCLFNYGNINYIDFSKIENYPENSDRFDFLIYHQDYCNHWTPEWKYDIDKNVLINTLEEYYEVFFALKGDKTELNLLLGEISHYLHNLDVPEYYEKAIDHYKIAIRVSGEDFRPFWFLGFHYGLSANPDESINCFVEARKLLSGDVPAVFWEEYSYAAALANMPSNSIYAMDKAKEILGGPGYFEQRMGQIIRNRIVNVNKDSAIVNTELWGYSEGDQLTFINRPLGIKILADTTWLVNLYDYSNYMEAATFVPPPFVNEKGQEITCTIAFLIQVIREDESLSDYMQRLTQNYPEKNNFELTDKFSECVSLEVKDKETYKEIGGAHLHFIGIERDSPEYPGLILEIPASVPFGNKKKVSYYSPKQCKNRFEGKIFYAIWLDTCEDIYRDSFTVFKDFIENQVIIE